MRRTVLCPPCAQLYTYRPYLLEEGFEVLVVVRVHGQHARVRVRGVLEPCPAALQQPPALVQVQREVVVLAEVPRHDAVRPRVAQLRDAGELRGDGRAVALRWYAKVGPKAANQKRDRAEYSPRRSIAKETGRCKVLAWCTSPTDQSQGLDRNIPHPPTNRSPSIGIYLTHRPIVGPQ
eukprot:4934878-Pyramimonas_sp.AAC.1